MQFLTRTDLRMVASEQTINVLTQYRTDDPETTEDNLLDKAEKYAIAEVSAYLRDRYDISQVFNKKDDERDLIIVRAVTDIALYQLATWVPNKMGYEVRETRYQETLDILRNVQAGKLSLSLPFLTNSQGEEVGNSILYRKGFDKSKYEW